MDTQHPAAEHRLSLRAIAGAMEAIDPVFLHTPQYECEPLGAALGCRLVVKLETLNPIRSFKGRGAGFFVAGLADTARLVCASAGNFGQGLAYACRSRGLPLTVFAGRHANALKITRMQALGATVLRQGDDFDAAKLAAAAYAADTGAQMVEDGLEPRISEGAGTIGLELLQAATPFDALLIPLGNGAMLNGVARWAKAHAPHTQIIAVSAAGASAMVESWRAGRIVSRPQIDTIADGIGVRLPIPAAVADMRGLVDDAVLVEDATLVQAMQLAHRHLGLVLEPSGVAGIAALLEQRSRFAGARVATVLCGGNLTPEQMGQWL